MFKNIFKTASHIFIIISLLYSGLVNAQEKKEYKLACIGFYNLENLFDTIDSKDTHDSEFTPDGKKMWNSEKYYKKLPKKVTEQYALDMVNLFNSITKENFKQINNLSK